MSYGALSIVLHAHLPYVRHPEYPEFLEEDWLYEAITETYLPLLEVFDRCVDDGVPFRITLTLTPPLVGMLRDELLVSRYAKRLDLPCELCDKEEHRTRADPQFGPLAWHYRERLYHLRRLFHHRYLRDLAAARKRLPDGGVAAFARDPESSMQVWSAEHGYPGDPVYREFYRDIGWDLDHEYVRPYIQATGDRKNTGIKYYRITGKVPLGEKQPYDPNAARERAETHAGNFLFNRTKQIEFLQAAFREGPPPIIISPYDAELYGHWWYEGPIFLDYLIRKAAREQDVLRLQSPIDYLREYPEQQLAQPPMSSWGAGGYAAVWLDEGNDWIYRYVHKASERMIELARIYQDASGVTRRALNQAARELLLAQSSDWAFIIKTGTMVDYAVRRTREHLLRFSKLYDQLKSGGVDEMWLASVEGRDNLFPEIDYRVYRPA